MTPETIIRITKEVAIGREPETPDDEEMAALRDRLAAERAAMASAGKAMDIGYDWEEPEPGEWGSTEWFADLKAKGKTYP